MLKLFRSSQLSSVFAIIVIALILWTRSFCTGIHYTFLFDTASMPLYKLLVGILPQNNYLLSGFSLLLVIAMGFYLLKINERFIIIKQRSYMLLLFSALVASSIFPVQRITPAIFAAFFIAFAINNIFSTYLKKDALDNVFRAGISLGISILLYVPAIAICPILFLGLIFLRSMNIREWFLALLGLIIPASFYLFILFIVDIPVSEAFEIFLLNLRVHSDSAVESVIPLVFIAFVGLPLVLSLIYLIPSMRVQKISVRKYLIIIFWLLLLSILAFIAIPSTSYEIIYIIAIPVSFLFTNLFMNIKINFWSKLLFSLILIGATAGQLLYQFLK